MDEHIYVEHNVSSNCEYVSEPDKVWWHIKVHWTEWSWWQWWE